MRTAIDSNVLSALCSKEPLAGGVAQRLGNAKREGGLVVGAPVYAELLIYPKATESFVNSFLANTGIVVDFELQQPVWLEAGRRFARYTKRRRKTGQATARRLLADFVIGSHGLSAGRLSHDARPEAIRARFSRIEAHLPVLISVVALSNLKRSL
jgi:predicted nucleic acid-binding protein